MNFCTLKTSIFVVTIFWINIAMCQSRTYNIKGYIPQGTNINKMIIYKYHNMFDQEEIGEIEVINDLFEFKYSLSEVDSYMIENPINKHFIIFIWDNDIEIKIDSIEFSNSTILNSPLTTELISFSINLEEQVYSELRHLDSLISLHSKNKSKDPLQLDSLNRLKVKAMDLAIKQHRSFYLNYITNHLDSFVSLYLLTITGGMEFRLDYSDFFRNSQKN